MIATEASGSAPSSAAVPEAPKDNPVVNPLPNSNQPQGVVVPKERDTSATAKKDSGTAQTTEVVPTIPSSQAVVKPLSVAELPSPPSSPPSSPPPLVPSNIPPPPQHPPPTPEELAARAPAFAKAREAVERNQEEEEEESFEVESEEEPAPVGKAASPRERHPKRDRSNPPLPVNLLSREAREQIELARELRAAG